MQNEDNWTVADILEHRNNWNLAADAKLLGCIEHLSEKLLRNAEVTIKGLNELECELEETSVNISTINNRFHLLADKQFIESKVADEETNFHEKNKQGIPERAVTSNADTSYKLRESLDNGIRVIDAYYDVIEVKGSDSEDEQHLEEIVLKARNRYATRKLPHMIGSEKFMRNDHVGISEISSSEEEEIDEGEEEEYIEIEKPKKLVIDSGDTETDESGDIDSNADTDTDIGAKPEKKDTGKETMESQLLPPPKPYSDRINFANELAARLRLNKPNDSPCNEKIDESFRIPPHVGDSSCPPPFPTNSAKDSDESDDELFSRQKDQFHNNDIIVDDVEVDEFSKDANLYDDESMVDNMFNPLGDDSSIYNSNSKNHLYGSYTGYVSNEPPLITSSDGKLLLSDEHDDQSSTSESASSGHTSSNVIYKIPSEVEDNLKRDSMTDVGSNLPKNIIEEDVIKKRNNDDEEIVDTGDSGIMGRGQPTHVDYSSNTSSNFSYDEYTDNKVIETLQEACETSTVTNYSHNQNKFSVEKSNELATRRSTTTINDGHEDHDIFSVRPLHEEIYHTNPISLFEQDDDDQEDLFAELVSNKDAIARANISRKQKAIVDLKDDEHSKNLSKIMDINEKHKPQNKISTNHDDVLSGNNSDKNNHCSKTEGNYKEVDDTTMSKIEPADLPGKLSIDRGINIDVGALLPNNMWPSRNKIPRIKQKDNVIDSEIETSNSTSKPVVKSDDGQVSINENNSKTIDLLPTVIKQRPRIPGKRRPPSRRITHAQNLNSFNEVDHENEVIDALDFDIPSEVPKRTDEKLTYADFNSGSERIPYYKIDRENKSVKDESTVKNCDKKVDVKKDHTTNFFEEDTPDEDLFTVKEIKFAGKNVQKSNSTRTKNSNKDNILIIDDEEEDEDLFGVLGRNKMKSLSKANVKESCGTNLFDDVGDSDDEDNLFKASSSKTCGNLESAIVVRKVDGEKLTYSESYKSRLVKLKGKATNDDPLMADK